ncbi:MAG: normocyte-binding protein [Clostridiaceae bacterium]|jgi:hypothetical protein|nr:normocyte-binding protein [Clostridiaceae bacterium]
MKELILEKLSKMEDLEQRKMLKDIMSSLFVNLIDYQENESKRLVERVFSEIEDTEKKYDVYITVCHKNDFDPVSEFLFPFFEEDVLEKKVDMKEIVKGLYNKETLKLFTVFLKCDYKKICKVNQNKRYKGTLITDFGRYPITVRLVKNEAYTDQIKKLYEVFQKNEIPWRTINNPYTNKFFDIFLDSCDVSLDENEEIKEIVFDLEEYEEYKMIDIIPLWNIKKHWLKTDGFPMPTMDRLNFEHIISIKKFGSESGYLVEESEHIFRYVNRSDGELSIISPEEKAGDWCIVQVSQRKDDTVKNNKYEVASNSRKESFINKFANRQAYVIRTKGEITRVVNSFGYSKYFEMEDVEIRSFSDPNGQTYDMNFFITDDIRVGNDKKFMAIKFKKNAEETFITYDLLSFLVSEVQMYFPEYKCEGVLI